MENREINIRGTEYRLKSQKYQRTAIWRKINLSAIVGNAVN